VKDPQKAEAVYKVIRERLDKYRKERPGGYLVREAPADDLKQLKILTGHLKEGQFVTKFRKTFTKAEMDDDLFIAPANSATLRTAPSTRRSCRRRRRESESLPTTSRCSRRCCSASRSTRASTARRSART